MFRIIAYIVGFLLFASMFRWVMAAFKAMLSDDSPSPGTGASRGAGTGTGAGSPPSSSGRSDKPVVAGELRRCPVCGTYSANSLTKPGKGGEVLYFCSAECQSKHVGA